MKILFSKVSFFRMFPPLQIGNSEKFSYKDRGVVTPWEGNLTGISL